jgi:hypothetical protein
MDRETRIKALLGYKITPQEIELMPFLELQDKFEMTEKEKNYIGKQHLIASIERENILLSIFDNPKANKEEIKKKAQDTFDNIMKTTYNKILENRR